MSTNKGGTSRMSGATHTHGSFSKTKYSASGNTAGDSYKNRGTDTNVN